MTDLTPLSELERRVKALEEKVESMDIKCFGYRGLEHYVQELRKKTGNARRVKALKEKADPKNRDVWAEYGKAFVSRYNTKPTQNAKNNALIKQLVQRVGHENAVRLAGFYVRQQDAKYLNTYHSLTLLVMDCEGLLVRLSTGKSYTKRQAEKLEQQQKNADVQQDYLRRKHGKNMSS